MSDASQRATWPRAEVAQAIEQIDRSIADARSNATQVLALEVDPVLYTGVVEMLVRNCAQRRDAPLIALNGHPSSPAKAYIHGQARTWSDLAGVSDALRDLPTVVISGMSEMLMEMPARMRRLISALASNGRLVVLLEVQVSTSLLLGLREDCLRLASDMVRLVGPDHQEDSEKAAADLLARLRAQSTGSDCA
jgi:hypothetical protein